mgnify:CR=1 FL=1
MQLPAFVFAEGAARIYLQVPVTVDLFKAEIEEALRNFDRHVVCIDKTLDECRRSVHSLVKKALDVYQKRKPGFRHGIALDKHLTVILSQSETDRPLCGIYFNLHSPYTNKPQRE